MDLVLVRPEVAPLRALDWAVLSLTGGIDRVQSIEHTPANAPATTQPYILLKNGDIFSPTERMADAGLLLSVRWIQVTFWLRKNVHPDWEAATPPDDLLPILVRALVSIQVKEFHVPEQILLAAQTMNPCAQVILNRRQDDVQTPVDASK